MAMVKKQVYVFTATVEGNEIDPDFTPPLPNVFEKTNSYIIAQEFDNAQDLNTYITKFLTDIWNIERYLDWRLIMNMNVMRKTKYVDSNS